MSQPSLVDPVPPLDGLRVLLVDDHPAVRDVIRKVRALPAGRGGQTPAAALTGLWSAEDRAQILRAGFQYHVPKPVDARRLVAIVGLLAVKE